VGILCEGLDFAKVEVRVRRAIDHYNVAESKDTEFALVLARRRADGGVEPIAVVEDEAMIERAIKRGTGELEGGQIDEIMFEGYGPGGAAVLVMVATDNRNRTVSEIRHAFSKNGGNLGASGSVSHGFERLGLIEYPATSGDDEKVLEAAIESGADDVESDEDGHRIWTSVESLHEVARALEPMLGEAEGAKLAWRPSTEVEVRGDQAQQLARLMEALDEDDDVQTVWGNEHIPDEELANLA